MAAPMQALACASQLTSTRMPALFPFLESNHAVIGDVSNRQWERWRAGRVVWRQLDYGTEAKVGVKAVKNSLQSKCWESCLGDAVYATIPRFSSRHPAQPDGSTMENAIPARCQQDVQTIIAVSYIRIVNGAPTNDGITAVNTAPVTVPYGRLQQQPTQYQDIPGALTLISGYVTLLALCAANMAFPAFFSLSQFLFCENIRYHRSHWSHIRSDRFRRLVDNGTMSIFVQGAHRRTVPILFSFAVVPKDSTINYVLDTLRMRGHIPINSHRSHSLYMPGRLRRLFGYLTMAELNLGSLSHLEIRVRILGGSNTGTYSLFWRYNCR
ncbi:hypothetical protein DFH08DRAFT_827634 [Mycena albidolilacea]|uniref:Uncharacterized protein n=1 Tax=Mycena albidolilacea TaxID=1033008 RepID=A0AAD6YYN3_9AGAR|nr:hypothetical protein DFH08DRAFT_827634 [Mycena albidolilacea]